MSPAPLYSRWTHPPTCVAFKTMDAGGVPREDSKTPQQTKRRMCLVEIVQRMWLTGEIPKELGWTVLVLTPKGTTHTWGIGLLETPCKVV